MKVTLRSKPRRHPQVEGGVRCQRTQAIPGDRQLGSPRRAHASCHGHFPLDNLFLEDRPEFRGPHWEVSLTPQSVENK